MKRWPLVSTLSALVLVAPGVVPARAWEPTRPIEFVIPAGTGGGADQMARLIAGIAEESKLAPRPFVVVNKSGGPGPCPTRALIGFSRARRTPSCLRREASFVLIPPVHLPVDGGGVPA